MISKQITVRVKQTWTRSVTEVARHVDLGSAGLAEPVPRGRWKQPASSSSALPTREPSPQGATHQGSQGNRPAAGPRDTVGPQVGTWKLRDLGPVTCPLRHEIFHSRKWSLHIWIERLNEATLKSPQNGAGTLPVAHRVTVDILKHIESQHCHCCHRALRPGPDGSCLCYSRTCPPGCWGQGHGQFETVRGVGQPPQWRHPCRRAGDHKLQS